MTGNDLAKVIVDLCLKNSPSLTPGTVRICYEEILCYETKKTGLAFERRKKIEVIYEGVKMKIAFRADLIVEGNLILELKSMKRSVLYTAKFCSLVSV